MIMIRCVVILIFSGLLFSLSLIVRNEGRGKNFKIGQFSVFQLNSSREDVFRVHLTGNFSGKMRQDFKGVVFPADEMDANLGLLWHKWPLAWPIVISSDDDVSGRCRVLALKLLTENPEVRVYLLR